MTTEPATASRSTVIWLLLVDAVLITLFATVGVSSHAGDLDPLNIARVALPFLLPYLVLAGSIKPTRLIHNIFPAGIALWIMTVILGPILRAMFFGDTSATAFILVTAGVLAVFLLGRRTISTLIVRRAKTPLD